MYLRYQRGKLPCASKRSLHSLKPHMEPIVPSEQSIQAI